MQPTQTPAREPDAHPTTPVVLTPATYLRGAGLYLVRHGWRQGDMFDCLTEEQREAGTDIPFPAACALGAIRMAVYGTKEITVDTAASCAFSATVGVLADHLVTTYGVSDPSDAITSRSGLDLEEIVAGWNDDPARIAGHVIAALSMAADGWDRMHRKADPDEPVCCNLAMGQRTYPSPGGPVGGVAVYFCATCQEWAYADDIDRCPSEVSGGGR